MTVAAHHPVPLSRDARRTLTAQLFTQLQGLDPTDDRRTQELHRELVLANAQVAQALARRFRGRGIDLEDLEQTAYVALVRAVRQFDHQLGHDFMVYAVPTITGELKRHFRDHGWTIRVPRRIQETQRLLERHGAEAPGVGESYDNQRVDGLAQELGLDRQDVVSALSARGCFTPASLDEPRGEDGTTGLAEILSAGDEDFRAADARLVLEPLLSCLSRRDRLLLHLRFVEERSQREIGDELGLSQVQVSRLLVRLLSQLREQLVDVEAA